MVKKRGGRRGKGKEQLPETSTSQSQEATPGPSSPTQSETSKLPKPKHDSALPKEHSSQQTAWGRGSIPRGISEEQRPSSTLERAPQQTAWGRGTLSRGVSEEQRPGSTLERAPQQSAWGQGAIPRGVLEEQKSRSRTGRGRGRTPVTQRLSEPIQETISHPQTESSQLSKHLSAAAPREEAQGRPKPGSTLGRGRGNAPVSRDLPRPGPVHLAPSLTDFAEIEKQLEVKPGTCGRKIRVETNHLKLSLGNLKQIYRYDVEIEPDKPKKMLRMAMGLFRQAHFPENNPSYDGQKIMVSAKPLPFLGDVVSDTIVLQGENGRDKEFKITVKLTGVVDISPLNNLLQKNISYDEAFQCVEIVFRQAYTQSFISVGRRFFTPARANENPVGLGAQMYLGGCQAAVKGWIPFLNVDVAHKAFTKETAIKDIVIEMFSTRAKPINDQDLRTYALTHWQIPQLEDYLKDLKIIYQIPNHEGSKKVYRVNGLKKSPTEETFSVDEKTISIKDYFNKRWNYKLKYNNLPTLWVGAKGTILLPMELCTLQGGQPLQGNKVTDNQIRQIIRYAATSTTERKNKIQNIVKIAGYNENPCIKEFGFSVSDQFQQLDARVLDPPELKYSNNMLTPSRGMWEGRKYLKAAEIQNWTIVGVAVNRDQIKDDLNRMAHMIMDFGNKNGMTFSQPAPFGYIPGDVSSLNRFLAGKKSFELIIAVFPSFKKDLYYTIKQTAELNLGCLTQCVTSETVSRRLNDATIKNILLKINRKLNGTTHVINNFNLIDGEPCMIMGADVTHPSPQAQNIPSVVAVTASHDLYATNYNITTDLQKPRTEKSEIIQRMEQITARALKTFFAKTGKDPKRIYFFRDGVSEGEFQRVKDVEIQSIIRGCNAYKRGFRPKITFLVVQKRHHTRFFPLEKSDSGGDKHFNAPAGTCVDTIITDPDPTRKNFYLLSHASIQGVSRPTKYCTLQDENNLSNDDVEKLTYYLCHVFARCNRAVSYPAPTYYAHLAADRAKGYLRGKTIDMENLNLKLIAINAQLAERNPMYFI